MRRKGFYKRHFVSPCRILQRLGKFITTTDVTYNVVDANRDAGYLNFSKYNKVGPVLDDTLVQLTSGMMKEVYGPIMENSRLTEGYDNLCSFLDLKSSGGYPWTTLWQEKKMITDHRFITYFNKFMADIQSGVHRWVLFVNIVKEELKPILKLLLNKVRVFTAAPVEMTLLGYYLFLDQNDKLIQASRRNLRSRKYLSPVCIGINKFNGGWDNLYASLVDDEFSVGYACDISEWDSGCFELLFTEIYKLRQSCLLDQSVATVNAMRAYFTNLVHTVVVLDDGDIVQKHTGNCSGQVNTITDNSLILTWMWFYAWLVCKPIATPNTWKQFQSEIRLYVCGDDSLMSIRSGVSEYFNPKTFGRVFGQCRMGFKFTSLQPEPIHELSFCSMSFVQYKEKWIPVPEYSKVISSLVCKNRTDTNRTILLRALALRLEAYFCYEARAVIDAIVLDLLNDPQTFEEPTLVKGDMFNVKQILTLFKSDAAMEELYLKSEIKCLPPTAKMLTDYGKLSPQVTALSETSLEV